MLERCEIQYETEFSLHPKKPNVALLQVKATLLAMSQEKSKHVIFILDKSGSMAGDGQGPPSNAPIALVKLAVKECLQKLNPNDHLTILFFNESIQEVTINQNVGSLLDNGGTRMKSLLDKLDGVSARSNTNMEQAFQYLSDKGIGTSNDQYVSIILMTDGKNSLPIEVETDCLRPLRASFPEGLPIIIPIGKGVDYQMDLLNGFARHSGLEMVLHISAPGEIQEVFEHAYSFTEQRTPPLRGNIEFRGTQLIYDIGALKQREVVKRVVEVTLPEDDLDSTLTISTQQGEHQRVVNAAVLRSLRMNKEILAGFALQKMLAIVSNSGSRREKQHQLCDEIMPLIFPNSFDDSDYVKWVQQQIISMLNAFDSSSDNEIRAQHYKTATGARYTEFKGKMGRATTKLGPIGVPDNTIELPRLGRPLFVNYDYDFSKIHPPQPILFFDPEIPRIGGQRKESFVLPHDSSFSEFLERYCAKFLGESRAEGLHNELRLLKVSHFVRDYFTDSDLKLREAPSILTIDLPNEQKERPILVTLFSYFMEQHRGVVRHQAFLTALILGEFVKSNLLAPGSVRFYRGKSLDGTLIHTMVFYNPESGQGFYLIDPSNPTGVANLLNADERATATRFYAERGLSGILEEPLSQISALSVEEQSKIPEGLILSLTDEQIDGLDSRLKCPISELPFRNPVCIEGQPKTHVFDEESIKEWFKRKQTNPITTLPCVPRLKPAVGFRQGLLIELHTLQKIPAEYSSGEKLPIIERDFDAAILSGCERIERNPPSPRKGKPGFFENYSENPESAEVSQIAIEMSEDNRAERNERRSCCNIL